MKRAIPNLLLLLFIFILQFGYGQANMEDVVYLKNGSIVRGIIIEQIPNQSLKIQTNDRSIFLFKVEEVEKMTRENIPGTSLAKIERKKNGYVNITEINFCQGITGDKLDDNVKASNKDRSFGFKTVNGYQASEHFSIGLGLGIDRYIEATLVPITLDMRFPLLIHKTSPVFNFGIGGSAGLGDAKGGFTTNFGFGIRSYTSNNSAFILNLGYKLQSSQIEFFEYSYTSFKPIAKKVTFGFLSINAGFSF